MKKNLAQTGLRYSIYPILVLSLCAAFQFYKYVLQVYPSIITDQLMNEFQLTGTGLGNLAATFYYTFIITQLFVGLVLDKFGARFMAAAAILCCACGVFFFSHSHTAFSAGMCRALIGVGVAFSTVTYMKLAAVWFPSRHYAFVTGLLATATMAGAVFGQLPLAFFIHQVGWRQSLSAVGLAGFVLTLLFVFVVRDKPTLKQSNAKEKTNVLFNDIVEVLKNKQNWLLTIYCGLAFSPISIFGGLWGNPFLQQAYHLSNTQAASMIALIFIGLGIGSPIIGLLSDRLGGNRIQVMFYSTFISCAAISLVLYCHPMPTWILGSLLFIFGFSLGAYLLAFALGKELNKATVTATVIAMINAGDALLTGVTEPAIGKLLDLSWDGKIINGVHHFTLSGYQSALIILPLYLASAALLLLWVKSVSRYRENAAARQNTSLNVNCRLMSIQD